MLFARSVFCLCFKVRSHCCHCGFGGGLIKQNSTTFQRLATTHLPRWIHCESNIYRIWSEFGYLKPFSSLGHCFWLKASLAPFSHPKVSLIEPLEKSIVHWHWFGLKFLKACSILLIQLVHILLACSNHFMSGYQGMAVRIIAKSKSFEAVIMVHPASSTAACAASRVNSLCGRAPGLEKYHAKWRFHHDTCCKIKPKAVVWIQMQYGALHEGSHYVPKSSQTKHLHRAFPASNSNVNHVPWMPSLIHRLLRKICPSLQRFWQMCSGAASQTNIIIATRLSMRIHLDVPDISWHSWHCIYWNLIRLDLFFFDPGKTMACPLWSSSAATTWVAYTQNKGCLWFCISSRAWNAWKGSGFSSRSVFHCVSFCGV